MDNTGQEKKIVLRLNQLQICMIYGLKNYTHLDFEGPFEAAGEKASKRSHDGGKARQGDAVDLERVQLYCGLKRKWERDGNVLYTDFTCMHFQNK